jgi:hypothetical protein
MLFSLFSFILYNSKNNKKPKIAYFISDHGFGHATRSLLVIKQLIPYANIMIISKVPPVLFENLPVEIINQKVDVGVIQKSSVEIDFEATLNSLQEYWENYQKKVSHFSQILKTWGVTKIISDTTVLGYFILLIFKVFLLQKS